MHHNLQYVCESCDQGTKRLPDKYFEQLIQFKEMKESLVKKIYD